MKIALKRIACLFKGHQVKMMLIENEIGIFQYGCTRCGCTIGLPVWWKGVNGAYPPWCVSDKEKKECDELTQIMMQERRAMVLKKIKEECPSPALFRIRFKVSSIEMLEGQEVLKARSASGSEVNHSFNKHTPCGDIILYITKETIAYGQLKPGQEFYMDISPIST